MTTAKIRFPRPDQAVLDWIEDLAFREPEAYESCAHCAHIWHGIRCNSCVCVTSSYPVDCTWRSHRTWAEDIKILQIMTDTGCDGWVARKIRATQRAGESLHIKAALYGRKP